MLYRSLRQCRPCAEAQVLRAVSFWTCCCVLEFHSALCGFVSIGTCRLWPFSDHVSSQSFSTCRVNCICSCSLLVHSAASLFKVFACFSSASRRCGIGTECSLCSFAGYSWVMLDGMQQLPSWNESVPPSDMGAVDQDLLPLIIHDVQRT